MLAFCSKEKVCIWNQWEWVYMRLSTGGWVMAIMVSSHAGLSCPTSWCCGSSSGFLPVGMAAVWANPKERWVLMCRGTFCDTNMGGLYLCYQPLMVFAKIGTGLTRIWNIKSSIRPWQDYYNSYHVCLSIISWTICPQHYPVPSSLLMPTFIHFPTHRKTHMHEKQDSQYLSLNMLYIMYI